MGVAPQRRLIRSSSEGARRARHLKLISLHVNLVDHCFACTTDDCPSSNCRKFKRLLYHLAACKRPDKESCVACQRAWALLKIYNRHRHRVRPQRPESIDSIAERCSGMRIEEVAEY
mmetsp:Transcript_1251/g.3170  ORF Transcript_1251/g.3170 Transcript_1251/m.3170 type:complete len:117 (-) Transcript_1251:256-606(-)